MNAFMNNRLYGTNFASLSWRRIRDGMLEYHIYRWTLEGIIIKADKDNLQAWESVWVQTCFDGRHKQKQQGQGLVWS